MKKRKQTIPKPMREAVWRKDHQDKLNSKCPVCMENYISAFNFECSHIVSEYMGGEVAVNNLMAICNICNKSMGTQNLNEYKKRIWKGRIYPSDKKIYKKEEVWMKDDVYKKEEEKTEDDVLVESIVKIFSIWGTKLSEYINKKCL